MGVHTSGIAVASSGSAHVLTVDLPADASGATRARELARQQLAGSQSPEVLDTVTLVVTELVTNAVLHAQTDLRLMIETRHGRVRIAFEDHAPSLPQRVDAEPDALTGRGLALVEHLSSSWGVDASASGKVVWSEIAA